MFKELIAPLMGALWFFTAIVLAALYISAAAQGELTSAHVLLTFVFLGLAVGGTAFLMRLSASDTEQDKAKRERVDSLLRDMSDEELVELKHRLEAVDAAEKPLSEYLGDDGELVQRR